MGHLGHKGVKTTHGSKEIKKGKDKVKVCKIYTTITCEEHIEIAQAKWTDFFGEQRVALPQHVFVDAAGKEFTRRAGSMSAQDLAKEITDTSAKIEGDKVPKGDYEAARTAIQDGLEAVKAEEIKKAIAAFTKVTKSPHSRLHPLGEGQLQNLQVSGDARIEAAVQLTGTNLEEAKKTLRKIADDFKPLECATKAAELLKAIEKKKE